MYHATETADSSGAKQSGLGNWLTRLNSWQLTTEKTVENTFWYKLSWRNGKQAMNTHADHTQGCVETQLLLSRRTGKCGADCDWIISRFLSPANNTVTPNSNDGPSENQHHGQPLNNPPTEQQKTAPWTEVTAECWPWHTVSCNAITEHVLNLPFFKSSRRVLVQLYCCVWGCTLCCSNI